MSEPTVDALGWDAALDEVTTKLSQNVGRSQRSVCRGLGEAQQGVAQVGRVERAGVEERGEGHGCERLSTRLGTGRGLVQAIVLGVGGHLVERSPALGSGAFGVVQHVPQKYAAVPAAHGMWDFAVGE